MQAARRGEPFDEETGLPASESRTPSCSVQLGLQRVGRGARAATGLAKGSHLARTELSPERRPGKTRRSSARPWMLWVRSWTGSRAAARTALRKRACLSDVLGMAAEATYFTTSVNPPQSVQWTAPRTAEELDPEAVANPRQVRRLLAAVQAQSERGQRLEAFFGCLYYPGLRPAEAIHLQKPQCRLPGAHRDIQAIKSDTRGPTKPPSRRGPPYLGPGRLSERRQSPHIQHTPAALDASWLRALVRAWSGNPDQPRDPR